MIKAQPIFTYGKDRIRNERLRYKNGRLHYLKSVLRANRGKQPNVSRDKNEEIHKID